MNERPSFTSIDEYIASAVPEARPILEEIRKTIKQVVPAAKETINYQMPLSNLVGRLSTLPLPLLRTYSIYPPIINDESLRNELVPYSKEKGNMQFPLSDSILYPFIPHAAVALLKQYCGTETRSFSKNDYPES